MPEKLKTIKTNIERDLGHCLLVLRADNVLVMHCDEDTIYEEDQIREIVAATGELTKGKKCGHLSIAGRYSSLTREARDFAATDEAVKYTLAEAYVIQSLAQRIMGNFYLSFYKPKVPTKVFTDLKKAEAWLKRTMASRSNVRAHL